MIYPTECEDTVVALEVDLFLEGMLKKLGALVARGEEFILGLTGLVVS